LGGEVLKKCFLIAFIALICLIQVSAENELSKARIEINIPSLTLSLYNGDILLKEYPVCLGNRLTPTPQGEYRIIYKTVNPYWINKDVVVPPGPQNPLGARWIGIIRGIGIHGNNKPKSIGRYESAGCIRMYNRDVEELYNLAPVNTSVAIKYERLKVFEDKYSGEKAAIIYPDSYKKDDGSNQLLESFAQLDFHEDLMKKAHEVLAIPSNKPLTLSQGIGIFLNNCLITCDALEEQGEIFMNHKAAKDVLGLTAEIAELFDIDTKELEETIYINLTQAVKSFGGSMSYDKSSGNAYINMKIIKVNGTFAGINYGNYDREDFLSAEAVRQLGYEYSEDSVDIRIFDKGIMKLKRRDVCVVKVDSLAKVMEGYVNISSRDGIVNLNMPIFLRMDEEYFKADNIDGRLVLNKDTACSIYERDNRTWEAENIDLEIFLEGYDYTANNFGTVIDIKLKDN
jgi:hypothetical protein